MNIVKSLLCASCGLICFLAGCAGPTQYETVEQICLPAVDSKDAMQIAENVLSRMHFTIAKADTDQGLLRTRPLPGPQFCEFWRTDHSAEANLHSIRRTVELNISQQNKKLCIGCDVKVQRLSLPELRSTGREVRGTRSMQNLNLPSQQRKGMAWADLGDDPRLETEILKRIEKRLKHERK